MCTHNTYHLPTKCLWSWIILIQRTQYLKKLTPKLYIHLAVTIVDVHGVFSKEKTLGLSLLSLCHNINIVKFMDRSSFLVITCCRKIAICVWDSFLQIGN